MVLSNGNCVSAQRSAIESLSHVRSCEDFLRPFFGAHISDGELQRNVDFLRSKMEASNEFLRLCHSIELAKPEQVLELAPKNIHSIYGSVMVADSNIASLVKGVSQADMERAYSTYEDMGKTLGYLTDPIIRLYPAFFTLILPRERKFVRRLKELKAGNPSLTLTQLSSMWARYLRESSTSASIGHESDHAVHSTQDHVYSLRELQIISCRQSGWTDATAAEKFEPHPQDGTHCWGIYFLSMPDSKIPGWNAMCLDEKVFDLAAETIMRYLQPTQVQRVPQPVNLGVTLKTTHFKISLSIRPMTVPEVNVLWASRRDWMLKTCKPHRDSENVTEFMVKQQMTHMGCGRILAVRVQDSNSNHVNQLCAFPPGLKDALLHKLESKFNFTRDNGADLMQELTNYPSPSLRSCALLQEILGKLPNICKQLKALLERERPIYPVYVEDYAIAVLISVQFFLCGCLQGRPGIKENVDLHRLLLTFFGDNGTHTSIWANPAQISMMNIRAAKMKECETLLQSVLECFAGSTIENTDALSISSSQTLSPLSSPKENLANTIIMNLVRHELKQQLREILSSENTEIENRYHSFLTESVSSQPPGSQKLLELVEVAVEPVMRSLSAVWHQIFIKTLPVMVFPNGILQRATVGGSYRVPCGSMADLLHICNNTADFMNVTINGLQLFPRLEDKSVMWEDFRREIPSRQVADVSRTSTSNSGGVNMFRPPSTPWPA